MAPNVFIAGNNDIFSLPPPPPPVDVSWWVLTTVKLVVGLVFISVYFFINLLAAE